MLKRRLLLELEKYVERHLSKLSFAPNVVGSPIMEEPQHFEEIPYELEHFVNQTRKPTFNQVLFGFIDNKGATDSDIYKRAGIDRRHFSKIRSNADYRPRKHTVIALALALELDKTQTDELLAAAGYSLSDSDTFDLVIRFFLEKEIYDIVQINEALHYFSLKPLAGVEE